jgi:hypothetical protein
MYVVGSDRISIADGRVVPAGDRHAIDEDGRVACRDRGASYTFPALTWSAEESDRCPECTRVVLEQHAPSAMDSYPSAEAADLYPMADPAYLLIPDSLGF